jgi:hypothetical protein
MSPLSAAMEIVRDVVFDTLYAPENLRNGRGALFSIPVGQYGGPRAQTKGYEDTSMLMAGCLPSPHKFLVHSLHCQLFDPDGGYISVDDHVWDGTLALEINCRVMKICQLREIADANITHILKSKVVNCKYYNIQEIENPLQDFSEMEQAVRGELKRSDRYLIETMQFFTGRVTFDHPIRVPMKAVFALNGICARAVC